MSKTRLGLAGIALTAVLNNTNIFSQKNDIPYLEETIHGVEYSDKKIGNDTAYTLEEQVLFGKIKKDMPVVFGVNPKIDDGELDFYVCPRNELSIAYGKNSIEIIPKMYIPTEAIDFFDRRIEKMELTGISALLKDKLKNTSQNSFGYSQIRTEKAEGILPRIKVNNQEYAYWMATKGKFITKDNKELLAKMIKGKSLDIVLFPITEDYKEIVNLECENITIVNPCGIYLLCTENIQKDLNKKQKITDKNISNIEKNVSESKTNNKKENMDKEKNCTYVVKKGETFWKIAERFYGTGKETEKLMNLNGYKTEDLKAGAILKVPCEKDL